MKKLFKDITLADCQQFKTEHPTMGREELSHHYSAMYKAMKHFNVLDELYPRKFLYSDTLTEEDCRRYHAEHPDKNRTEVRVHDTGYFLAMKKLGLLDELYPIERGFKILSIEACEQFKNKYPNMARHDICAKYLQYYKSMKFHNILDRLYPSRLSHKKYTDQDLIDIARKYNNIKALRAARPCMPSLINHRGLTEQAFAHMKRLGDDKHKLIYAFEFPDNSVYVGLTFNLKQRTNSHLHDEKRYSAVRNHINETGLQPTLKQLTELLDVDEACKMEGEWVEIYRKQGWTILNKAKTGAVGTVHNRKKLNKEETLRFAKQNLPPKEIARRLDINIDAVWKFLKNEGINLYKLNEVPIEILNQQGDIIQKFPSLTDACKYYNRMGAGIKGLNERLRRLKTGYTARFNKEKYIIRYGHKYGEKK